jgi:hypothetical protein
VQVSHLGVWERRIGLRLARRQRLAEQIGAIERGEQTKPHTSEYEHFHLAARLEANRREAAVASVPCSPSTENIRGVKVRRWAMQRAPYFSFFSFSCHWRTFSGAVLRCNRASVSVTRTSKIAVMPLVQKPWTATLPRSSVRVDPATCTSQLVWISGLSEKVEGVWAWPQSCPHVATGCCGVGGLGSLCGRTWHAL